MYKVNLLVKCPVQETSQYAHANQIIRLGFENNYGGRLKVWGARSTQGIPSEMCSIQCSFGATGESNTAVMQDRDAFRLTLTQHNKVDIDMNGKLSTDISEVDLSFMRFVTDRPHKMLAFKGTQLAYSPESDPGSEGPLDGAAIVTSSILMLDILKRIPIDETAIDTSKVFAFVQPYYIIVDHVNTMLSPLAAGIPSLET